jgi:hypothetical protein
LVWVGFEVPSYTVKELFLFAGAAVGAFPSAAAFRDLYQPVLVVALVEVAYRMGAGD